MMADSIVELNKNKIMVWGAYNHPPVAWDKTTDKTSITLYWMWAL